MDDTEITANKQKKVETGELGRPLTNEEREPKAKQMAMSPTSQLRDTLKKADDSLSQNIPDGGVATRVTK